MSPQEQIKGITAKLQGKEEQLARDQVLLTKFRSEQREPIDDIERKQMEKLPKKIAAIEKGLRYLKQELRRLTPESPAPSGSMESLSKDDASSTPREVLRKRSS